MFRLLAADERSDPVQRFGFLCRHPQRFMPVVWVWLWYFYHDCAGLTIDEMEEVFVGADLASNTPSVEDETQSRDCGAPKG